MNHAFDDVADLQGVRTNGSGVAALLAAGVGCLALALLALAGDKVPQIKSDLVFYRPTGALSGVSTLAVLIWALTWVILAWRWKARTVNIKCIAAIAFICLLLSFLLTFPPVVDLL